ncbi:MAG: sigma-54-dependent Fis family transcriptional regulator [Deltaproteobacteria bacterium]|nr:sigma-54-dependent Fis family transcriptional regulator [Deltaproteobacteria bacterium]
MTTIFRPTILYVDDEPANTLVFKKTFEHDFLVTTAQSGAEALAKIKEKQFVLCMMDQRMPEMNGITLCKHLLEVSPETVRVMVTAYQEPQLLLDAINQGHVHNYVVKPWKKKDCKEVIQQAFAYYKSRMQQVKNLQERVAELIDINQRQQKNLVKQDFVGQGIEQIKSQVLQIAPTPSTVMIYGETGTGKERLAHFIHQHSNRSEQPFIPIHCAALAENLLESELFGYEKGAFTGAERSKKGLFEIANGGTVFLDEIGEISEAMQVKLLRVLQEKQIQKIGATHQQKIDIRIIAATHKNLQNEVHNGRFRADLFYRLHVIPIKMPALRDRMQDLPTLIQTFVDQFNQDLQKNISFSKQAIEALQKYDWPGNVRELQNVIERAVVLASPNTELSEQQLCFATGIAYQQDTVTLRNSSTLRDKIAQQKKQELEHILLQAHGNIAQAARDLGVARSTLFDQLKKYNLI